jgi:neutral ceramidase
MPSDLTAEMKKQFRNGGLRENTWAPIILPVQIIRLGALAILGVPGEITTAAGIRLRQSVQAILEPAGILDVIITSLSNEYGGYFCTYEEYDLQKFEGASTLFGCWSLAALQTEFGKLAHEILKPVQSRRNVSLTQPPLFSDTELNLRSFNH